MVKIEDFEKEFIETFGFLLSQEIAKVAPKDTGRLARSFPGTFQVADKKIVWNVPFYFEYVEFSKKLRNNKLNPNFGFARNIIHTKTKDIAEKTFKILSAK